MEPNSMGAYETIKLEKDNGIATLFLHRPEHKNALVPLMISELVSALHDIQASDTRALIITGSGADFCAGGDIRNGPIASTKSAEAFYNDMAGSKALAHALAALDIPAIAAVNGIAYGAGLSIALWADIILVSDRARLSMVFSRVGFVPDIGALYTLPRHVGLQKAKEMIFSGREYTPAEALETGMAMEVVPADSLRSRATALAAAFVDASPIAVRMTKAALNSSLESSLSAMLELEATAQSLAYTSPYFHEALRKLHRKEPGKFVWPTLPSAV